MNLIKVSVLATSILLASCEYARVLSFKEDEASGQTGSTKFELIILDSKGAPLSPLPERSAFNEVSAPTFDLQFAEARKRHCGFGAQADPEALLAPFVLPLIGIAVDKTISYATSALQSRVDEFVSNGTHAYHATLIVDDPQTFGYGLQHGMSQCLLLIRSHLPKEVGKGKPEPTFVHLVKVTRKGRAESSAGAVTLTPVYTRLTKSVAITEARRGVQLAIAIAGSAVVTGKIGPERTQFGLTSYTIPEARFSETDVFDAETEGGNSSGLVPLHPTDATALELTASVVETGSAIPDADRAKAEIRALSDALGPAIKSQIGGRLTAGGGSTRESCHRKAPP